MPKSNHYRYPEDCPVCVFTNSKGTLKSFTIKEAIVKSISKESNTEKLSYQLVFKSDGQLYSFNEDKIGFAIGCPVFVSSGANSNDNSSLQPATVALCKKNKSGIIYTVELESTIKKHGEKEFHCDINSSLVSFREIKEDIVVSDESDTASQERNLSTNQDDSLVLYTDRKGNSHRDTPKIETNDTAISLAKHPTGKRIHTKSASNSVIPTQFENNDDGNTNASQQKRPEDTIGKIPRKKQKIDAKEESWKRKDHRAVTMPVPLWLQENSSMRKKLFHQLIGRDTDPYGHTSKLIMDKTGVLFNVNSDRAFSVPLSMEFRSNKLEVISAWDNAVIKARRIVENILINFDAIKDDGCKDRLLYEFAASHDGPHRQNESTSRAVKCSLNDEMKWISVVEISSEDGQGEKKLHEDFLHKRKNVLVDKLKNMHCEYQVFGVKDTHFGDPYVLVRGRSWFDVDKAVDIVKHEIQKEKYIAS